jgi:hypothetical protein
VDDDDTDRRDPAYPLREGKSGVVGRGGNYLGDASSGVPLLCGGAYL